MGGCPTANLFFFPVSALGWPFGARGAPSRVKKGGTKPSNTEVPLCPLVPLWLQLRVDEKLLLIRTFPCYFGGVHRGSLALLLLLPTPLRPPLPLTPPIVVVSSLSVLRCLRLRFFRSSSELGDVPIIFVCSFFGLFERSLVVGRPY